MSIVFVQGDTGPDISAILHREDDPDARIDLTTAQGVRFQMRKSDDRRFTVNAAATVVNAATGSVKYSWGANDLAVPGEYEVQWEVTFGDGTVITTATTTTITVRRQ